MDIVAAMLEKNITAQFEAWADKHCPTSPSYYEVLADIAQDRGAEQLYNDIMSGKFEEEIT